MVPKANVPLTGVPKTPNPRDLGIVNQPPIDVTKPVGSPAPEKRPPCGPPRDPWTDCVSGRLQRCTQALSHFGTKLCNYHNRCVTSEHPC